MTAADARELTDQIDEPITEARNALYTHNDMDRT